MQRLLAILCILAGCYEDPEYGATRFKCDATHECPPGQTCRDGRCSGGGADAASAVGVACGASSCGAGEKCCVDFINAPRCIALGVACSGFQATCDGSEDCSGRPCCAGDGSDLISCGTSCQDQICLEPSDCSIPGAMMCCPGLTGEPWGRCLSSCP